MELKNEYTFENQRGEVRTVTRIEEAKAIIVATAMVRGHNKEELIKDKQIQEVAEAFGIILEHVAVEPNDDPNDFPYAYYI